MESYRNGDISAFNVLFKRYYNSLVGYAAKNGMDFCTAEELVMDVMLRFWEKKGEVRVEDELAPYLYRAIKNAIYNHHRKKILPTTTLDLLPADEHLIAKPADEELNSKELEKMYREKLNQLSPQRRKVYEMSREEHMTYAEIAKSLDLSVNTVENYMVASLNFFRKQLKEHADFILVILVFSLFF